MFSCECCSKPAASCAAGTSQCRASVGNALRHKNQVSVLLHGPVCKAHRHKQTMLIAVTANVCWHTITWQYILRQGPSAWQSYRSVLVRYSSGSALKHKRQVNILPWCDCNLVLCLSWQRQWETSKLLELLLHECRASDRHSTAHRLQQDYAAGDAGSDLIASSLQLKADARQVEHMPSEQHLVRRQLGFSPPMEPPERTFSRDSLHEDDREADASDQPAVRRLSNTLSTVSQTGHRDFSGEALQGEDAEGDQSQKQPSVPSERLTVLNTAQSPGMQHQPDSVPQPVKGSTSALSKFVEQQSQEQLQQLLQQQLLRQLQQQWQQQPQQDTGIQQEALHEDEEYSLTGAAHNLNGAQHDLNGAQHDLNGAQHGMAGHVDKAERIDEATLASQQSAADCAQSADELVQPADMPLQSADISTQSADVVAQSAGKIVQSADGTLQTAAPSARQRMQAALQAVYDAERAVDAAVLFRPRMI